MGIKKTPDRKPRYRRIEKYYTFILQEKEEFVKWIYQN